MNDVHGAEVVRDEAGANTPAIIKLEPDSGASALLSSRISAAGASEQSADVPGPGAPQIFISYKISPDERIAAALKRLIEGSIDPQPNVFVSGEGGIRPSNVGAIPQMQQAAGSVRAFVGLITQASKDREWIFFEAGAAWGRNCLYAPLLVDTKPEDLPNTLGGYQATNALDQEKMRLLITELANAVGGTVKPRFGTRYSSFERVLRKYPDAETDDAEEGTDDLARAIQHLVGGRQEEGVAAFAKLETDAASDVPRLTRVRLARIVYDKQIKESQKLVELERLARDGESLAEYQFWRATYEPRHHVKIVHLTRCLELTPDSTIRELATESLAQSLSLVGRHDEAASVLWTAIADSDRDMSAMGAIQLFKTYGSAEPVARLLLLCRALSVSTADNLARVIRPAIDLAQSLSSNQLSVYLARRYSKAVADGISANAEGIALAAADLTSLAYLAYEKAALKGVAVAKVNMAALLAQGSVPAAGLAIFERHIGPYDAAVPHFPYRLRAEIEEQVHEQRTRADDLATTGKRLYHVLVEFSERAAAARGVRSTPHSSYRVRGEVYNAGPAPLDGDWVFSRQVTDKADSFTMSRGLPFDNLWIRRELDGRIGLYILETNGVLRGVRLVLDGEGVGATWETIDPVVSNDASGNINVS